MTKEHVMRRVHGSPVVRVVPAILVGIAGSSDALAAPPLPFPPAIELSSLTGSDGLVINGIDAGDISGRTVCALGDINGDGLPDILITASLGDPDGRADAGESYVVFGGPSVGASGSIEVSTLNGANGFVINGVAAGDNAGRSAAPAGDVNGDGVGDILIGATFADPNGQSSAGEVYVVFGGPGVGAAGACELSSLDGTNGFVLQGVGANDVAGDSVSGAGDVNGDGIDDLIIGARMASPGGRASAGQSYVVFGSLTVGGSGEFDLGVLDGTSGFVLNGIDDSDFSGTSVFGAGDVNDDGYDDVIIGAVGADPGGRDTAGESYVVFGGLAVGGSGSVELSSLNGANGFVINGIDAFDQSGKGVSRAGDINGDGIEDLIIGARVATPNGQFAASETYIVFGGAAVGVSGAIDLASLTGANGFVINGKLSGDQSGSSVAPAGDINHDGADDLMIGAQLADPNGKSSAGEAYIVFGGSGVGASGTLDLASLDGLNGFSLRGIDAGDRVGVSVSAAGDFNGDGVDDLIMGAYGADPGGRSSAGESYIVFGRAPVVCAGDVTGDGLTNSADFNILASFFGQFVAPSTSGDLTGDGLVNSADFNVLAGDFGCGAP